MYLRKTIVLVALAALAAAPSALASAAARGASDPAPTIVQHQPAAHPAKPAKPKAKLHARCKQCGPYCFSASS